MTACLHVAGMQEHLPEAVVELATVLAYAVTGSAATLLGVAVENVGVRSLMNGQTTIGLWEAWVGLLALFVGVYMIGYRKLLPRVRHAA